MRFLMFPTAVALLLPLTVILLSLTKRVQQAHWRMMRASLYAC